MKLGYPSFSGFTIGRDGRFSPSSVKKHDGLDTRLECLDTTVSRTKKTSVRPPYGTGLMDSWGENPWRGRD